MSPNASSGEPSGDGGGPARWLAAFFAPEMRAWRGEMRLWKVYWGYGVATSAALALLYFGSVREGEAWLQQGVLAALALYTIWILVAVWRCAAGAPPQWRFLARLSTVAWACNATLVLSFLQVELLLRVLAV